MIASQAIDTCTADPHPIVQEPRKRKGRPLSKIKKNGTGGHLLNGGTIIRVALLFSALGAIIYRPLPGQICETVMDKIAVHIIETVLRVSYYYPTRLCPDTYCMMQWTRGTLSSLAVLVGPIFDYDSELFMETSTFDGIKVRIYHPRLNDTTVEDGAIIFIHGGGFVLGNTEMYESLTRRMAKMMKTRLFISVDYRLAPETIFPGGLEDCEKVVDYVIRNGMEQYGVDPRKIVLMGDSAGGGLVASITQRRRERGDEPKILGQVLLYPLLQLSDLQSYSHRYFHREMTGLAFVDPLSVAYYYLWYAGVDVQNHPEYAYAAVSNGHVNAEAAALRDELIDHSVLPPEFDDSNGTSVRLPIEYNADLMAQIGPFLTNPDFAPLMHRDLSRLPSALVMTCEFDVLRDEGTMYAHRLKEAGVSSQWKHYYNGFHAILNFHGELTLAKQMLDEIEDWTMNLMRNATFDD